MYSLKDLNNVCAGRVGRLLKTLDELKLVDDFVPLQLYTNNWLIYLPENVVRRCNNAEMIWEPFAT